MNLVDSGVIEILASTFLDSRVNSCFIESLIQQVLLNKLPCLAFVVVIDRCSIASGDEVDEFEPVYTVLMHPFSN